MLYADDLVIVLRELGRIRCPVCCMATLEGKALMVNLAKTKMMISDVN